ncbi:hypothetical protein [Burkholderia pyrrocinia]|uniref:hypothetical protein n=1 Tax=Burkholderia pyrrocinia TaxID=60550 RepID=UPI0030D27F84
MAIRVPFVPLDVAEGHRLPCRSLHAASRDVEIISPTDPDGSAGRSRDEQEGRQCREPEQPGSCRQ